MLFSNASISEFINREFEPAWQSVRPAAIVRLDFGNGQTLTRTLNGNIATYVCTPGGHVLDVIPGVYDPATYLERLRQAVLLHRWAGERPDRLGTFLKNHHAEQAAALRQHNEPKQIVEVRDRPGSIIPIEAGMKLVLMSSLRGLDSGGYETERPRGPFGPATRAAAPVAGYDLPGDLASRVGRLQPEMLADDTRHNESVRRLQIHEHLAARSPATPADMTKWLYREVLNTDLDDPYLGLGKLLFATY
ncbi:MAG TPA: hypothetical protein VML55_25845, partial [Planctomycetaceae bacterium]|nr:hypothetical protein [Planctomycetaceae bacterium]